MFLSGSKSEYLHLLGHHLGKLKMTTLEAKRIQKYVEDREKQNDVERNLQASTWKDVLAKVPNVF